MAKQGFFAAVFSASDNFNSTLALFVLVLCTSQFNYGFDIATYSNLTAMPAFQKQFGWYNPKTHSYFLEASWLSFFSSLQFIGLLVGIIIGSHVSKHYGRRWCVFSMSLAALIFATISITSKNRWQIVIGRALMYIFNGMDMSVIPVLQAEITPARNRGLTVGTYQFVIAVAQVAVNGICRGTGQMESNAAWRIPLSLFFIAPTIVASCIWLFPESPRWLALQGRTEEARASLTRLRERAFTEAEIESEFQDILSALEVERNQERGHWKEMFRGTNLRRTWIIVSVNCFLAGSGANFAALYGAYFIQQMKFVNPFTVTLCSSIGVAILAGITMVLNDKVGRRFFPIAGASLLAAALLTMGGLGTVAHQSNANKIGIIACMQLCTLAYSAGWAPTVHILSVELSSPQLRDITYRFSNIIQTFVQFATSFVMPYLVWDTGANLQSKLGFIFGPVAVSAALYTFLFVPEAKGLSLEVVDHLFAEGTPARQFQQRSREYMLQESFGEVIKIHQNTKADKNESVMHLEDIAPAHARQMQ